MSKKHLISLFLAIFSYLSSFASVTNPYGLIDYKLYDGVPKCTDDGWKDFLYFNEHDSWSSDYNSYAVIINKQRSVKSSEFIDWNNCSAVYQMLTDVYRFKKENIFVLMGDGIYETDGMWGNGVVGQPKMKFPVDLDGDGTKDIEAETKDNISRVFNLLGTKQIDNLFIYVTGVVGTEIDTWGTGSLTPEEFSAEVDKVTASQMNIVMDFGYCGVYSKLLSKKGRTIITASDQNHTILVSSGYKGYNDFTRCWLSAMTGIDVFNGNKSIKNVDTDGDHHISMLESFQYVFSKNSRYNPQYNSDGCKGEYSYLDGTIPGIVGVGTGCDYLKATGNISNSMPRYYASTIWESYSGIYLGKGFKCPKGKKFRATKLHCEDSNTTMEDALRSSLVDDGEASGVNDVNSESGISIFPNPTDGLLYVRSINTINEIVVTDMTGKVVANVNGGSNVVSVDLSSNQRGIYLLKVITEEDSYVEKVILK